MARALLGYVGRGSEQALALEIVKLRRRVAVLETEVAALRERSQHPVHDGDLHDAEMAHSEIDLELHRLAESARAALT